MQPQACISLMLSWTTLKASVLLPEGRLDFVFVL
jgi:hypothetical protein